jgi:hypothetical protein
VWDNLRGSNWNPSALSPSPCQIRFWDFFLVFYEFRCRTVTSLLLEYIFESVSMFMITLHINLSYSRCRFYIITYWAVFWIQSNFCKWKKNISRTVIIARCCSSLFLACDIIVKAHCWMYVTPGLKFKSFTSFPH